MKPSRILISIPILTILVVLFAAGMMMAEDTKVSPNAQLKVTVMIFSGRPNPVYYIKEQDAVNQFKSLFGKNKKNGGFMKDTVIPNQLGYSGIAVENLKDITELPKKFIVYNNDIELVDPGATLKSASESKFLYDGSSQLETFLLDYGVNKNSLHQEVREMIRKEHHK